MPLGEIRSVEKGTSGIGLTSVDHFGWLVNNSPTSTLPGPAAPWTVCELLTSQPK